MSEEIKVKYVWPNGLVRQSDNLGRFVIPAELRRVFGWDFGTSIEFLTGVLMDSQVLVLRKFDPDRFGRPETIGAGA